MLPDRMLAALEGLQSLQYLRIPGSIWSDPSREYGGFTALSNLHLHHLNEWPIPLCSQNIKDLRLSFEADFVIDWLHFSELPSLVSLKLSRGCYPASSSTPEGFFKNLRSLEIANCSRLGWLNTISDYRLCSLGLVSIVTPEIESFMASLRHPLQSLKLLFLDEPVFPRHVGWMIAAHGRHLEHLFLDGYFSWPLSIENHQTHMELIATEWRAFACSLPNLRILALRPTLEWVQPDHLRRLAVSEFSLVPDTD